MFTTIFLPYKVGATAIQILILPSITFPFLSSDDRIETDLGRTIITYGSAIDWSKYKINSQRWLNGPYSTWNRGDIIELSYLIPWPLHKPTETCSVN